MSYWDIYDEEFDTSDCTAVGIYDDGYSFDETNETC